MPILKLSHFILVEQTWPIMADQKEKYRSSERNLIRKHWWINRIAIESTKIDGAKSNLSMIPLSLSFSLPFFFSLSAFSQTQVTRLKHGWFVCPSAVFLKLQSPVTWNLIVELVLRGGQFVQTIDESGRFRWKKGNPFSNATRDSARCISTIPSKDWFHGDRFEILHDFKITEKDFKMNWERVQKLLKLMNVLKLMFFSCFVTWL